MYELPNLIGKTIEDAFYIGGVKEHLCIRFNDNSVAVFEGDSNENGDNSVELELFQWAKRDGNLKIFKGYFRERGNKI